MAIPDKINIDISFAGEHLSLTVPFEQQNRVRKTEAALRKLYDTWRQRFPKKSETELLAMIAYQYASFYAELQAREDSALQIANDCNASLDELLSSLGDSSATKEA